MSTEHTDIQLTRHDPDVLGRAAYDAYCETRDWKSFRGEPLPQWPEVQTDIKHGWITAALAVLEKADELNP